jgi:hypothetical protein
MLPSPVVEPPHGSLPSSSAVEQRPQTRLRVAAVMDTWILSGPGRQLAALSAALRDQGVELCVFMFHRAGRPPSPYAAHLDRAGVSYCVLPESGPLDVGLPARLARALDRFGPDIVQSHGYRTTTLVLLLRLLGHRFPWVAFFHGRTSENWKVRLYHALDRLLMRRADRIVVVAGSQLAEFPRAAPVRIIYNAAMDVAADGEPVSLDGLRTPGEPVVAVVGR